MTSSLLRIGIAAALMSAGMAAEVNVEAVVLELPNAVADPLMDKIRGGEIAPLKDLVSDDGAPKEESGAKLIARFEAVDFKDGKATHTVNHDAPGNREETFFYQVRAKDPEASTRMIGISLRVKKEKTYPLKNWRIDLLSPMTKEWSFSARHRSKETSRIVLEKASILPDFEKAGSSWLAFRMMERAKPAAKREQKLAARTFPADPDEFYRVEWRFRKGTEARFSHEDTTSMASEKSVIDLDDGQQRYGPAGEKVHFSRKSTGYTSRAGSERFLESKGSKTRMLQREVFRSNHEPDPFPVAIQRPARQRVVEYKGNLGEGKEQPSKVVTEFIAD
jgi:hypothetical protein